MSTPNQSMPQKVKAAFPNRFPVRAGFSLIETLGVVALIGMLLSLCAATLNRAYQVHHSTLDVFRELEQLNFWCERFRADAHQSLDFQLAAGPAQTQAASQTASSPATDQLPDKGNRPATSQTQQLTLTHPQGISIKYSVAEGQLIRSVHRGDQSLSREVLSAAPPAEVSWTVDQSGKFPVLGCKLNFNKAHSARQPLMWWARLSHFAPRN